MDKLLGTLLDLSLRKTATPQLVRVLYPVGLVLIVALSAGALIAGFAKGPAVGLVTLVVVPLMAVMALGGLRLGLEAAVALQRAANYAAELARAERRRAAETAEGLGLGAPKAAAVAPEATRHSVLGKTGF